MNSPKPGPAKPIACVGSATRARPDFDALATSFAGLSVAITVVAIVVGVLSALVTILSVVITVAWNRSSQAKAVADARDAATQEAQKYLQREILPQLTKMAQHHLDTHVASGVSTATGLAGGSSDGRDERTG